MPIRPTSFWTGASRMSVSGCRTLLAIACALPLMLAAGTATPQTEPAPSAVDRTAGVDCAGNRGGRPLAYSNPRYGFAMTYPSTFMLDPDSIPENGDSARFWTIDRQATAVVMGRLNGLRQSLGDLFREARQDVVENSRGVITYTRTRDNWFVVSGFIGDRIFYRRTLLAQGSGVIGDLWIEFPRSMRPCFEDAVTMMSLSLRQAGP